MEFTSIKKKTHLFVCIILFLLLIGLLLSTPAQHLFFQPFAWLSPMLSCLFLLPFTLCVFIKAESYYALRVTAIDHRLGLSGGRGGGAVWCGGFFFSPLFLHMCVCWESSCVGVAGWFLRSLSPVQECMLGCPGLTLPPCMCVPVYICVSVCVCSLCE